MISRRRLLIAPAIAYLATLPSFPVSASTGSKTFDYRIFREGGQIGQHRGTIRWDKDRTSVETEIDIPNPS